MEILPARRKKSAGIEELYDILSDPGETTNLAESHPEVASEFREKAQAWQAELPEEVISTGKYKHQY